jgi:hypothetical protein
MTIFTSAYKREIDDNDGWTNPVEVGLHRVYEGEPIRVQVGGTFGSTAHLDLDHARELREALDEAITLAEMAGDITPMQALRGRLVAAGVTAESPAMLDGESERLAREERWT